MARLGPPFWPEKFPWEKVHVGPFLVFFPRSWAHTIFLGAKMGCFGWGLKGLLKKCMCFFGPLTLKADLRKALSASPFTAKKRFWATESAQKSWIGQQSTSEHLWWSAPLRCTSVASRERHWPDSAWQTLSACWSRNDGQETEHMRIECVKTDRAHFRVHFVCSVKFPVSTVMGVFVGTPWCTLHRVPQLSWAFPWTSACTSSGASRGSLQGGASFDVEKAHFAAWKRGPENCKMK